MKKVISPTRIDIAGGTLDIWPLYTFLEKPKTVLMAIDRYTESAFFPDETSNEVIFESKDQKILTNPIENALPYLKLLWKYSNKPKGRLVTSSNVPKGSGLGGSSSLGISILHSMNHFEKIRAIEILKDLEARHLHVSTGLQDYFGASFGGIQSISWEVGGPKMKKLKWDHFEDFFICFDAGVSRNSGLNNWSITQRAVSKDKNVLLALQAIADSANLAESAIESKDSVALEKAIELEMKNRFTLDENICTIEMFETAKIGKEFGLNTWKICGAGGGGCFIFFDPTGDLEKQKKFKVKVKENLKTVTPLDFKIDEFGTREL